MSRPIQIFRHGQLLLYRNADKMPVTRGRRHVGGRCLLRKRTSPKSLEDIVMATGDDLKKLDMRIARIEKAERVDGADKLLRLTLDLGGDARTVFAGIKSAYEPESLEGRLLVRRAGQISSADIV